MYQDSSRNPITAVELVDTLLGPVQATLTSGAFGRVPRYNYDSAVSLESYEHLLRLYDELASAAELQIRKLKLQSTRQALQITLLQAKLGKQV